MGRLSAKEIENALMGLDGWEKDGDFITKEFRFKRFMDGIRFVNDVASVAERLDHHPDVHIRWTTVRLMVQTHDEGGVTALDIELASEIERSLKRGARQTR